MKLSGWGRYPVLEAPTHAPGSEGELRDILLAKPSVVARGNGRAYGDSAINVNATLETRRLNRMVSFDCVSGQLVAEAGVLLGDVISAFLPRGWFPMVTPGTKFVSLGGAIAADVHGKNHHKDGNFRNCVDWIDVMGPEGEVRRCSRHENSLLFDHTLGGMGLTGVILRAAIRLRSVETSWIRQSTVAAANLEEAMSQLESAEGSTYSVAWVDCIGRGKNLGRSLVMTGEHATRQDLTPKQKRAPLRLSAKRQVSVPFDLPSFALNGFSLQVFNSVYYWIGRRHEGVRIVDWDSYFYPLDAILNWNRLYGRQGFIQFQCVLPLDSSFAGLSELLSETAKAEAGSFLSVLKKFGHQDSAFSFPMEGYTLALDFPLRKKTLALLDRLDRITIEHGGRFYLAKDSRMDAETLRASDGRLKDFQSGRNKLGVTNKFESAQADRLAI